jgi:membrane-bound lytic murein transglycosylase A
MSTKMTNASSASKINKLIDKLRWSNNNHGQALAMLWIVGSLAGCGVMTSAPLSTGTSPTADASTSNPALPAPMTQAKSRWVAVPWSELPGWPQDALHEAWASWLQSCQRPAAGSAKVCADVQRLNGTQPAAQQNWLEQRFQPYRVETLQGATEGLLTSYYEPVFDASRSARPGYNVPLYGPPNNLGQRKPWFSREEMESHPQARAALKGKELVYLADPVDAMVLQIQGTGRIRVTEADGRVRMVRLAFAGTNDHPYKSIGSWLLEQGQTRDATWPGIKAWIAKNPQRVNELLWKNPRMVFFKEESLAGAAADIGPKGAQGVPLTAGRSIAVDPGSIPYGTPVWLASNGPQAQLQKLVLAQDTGSAIVGGIRADYFAGSGPIAGELAGRLKQPLRLWVLWPR